MSSVTVALTRGVAVAALTVAVLVVSPAAAPARTFDHADARGDVTAVVGPGFDYVPAPSQVNGDVLGVRFQHTATRVRVRMTFRDLHKADDVKYLVHVDVRTSKGVRRGITFNFSKAHWGPGALMSTVVPDSHGVRCAVRATVDDRTNVVVIGFPRTCLKRPRWIRMSAEGSTILDQPTEPSYFIDDALKRGHVDDRTPAKLSPRLYRGHRGPRPASLA